MDVVFARGAVTAAEIQDAIPDPPSYSAVRALLRVLVDKACLGTEKDGPRLVYRATMNRDEERSSVLDNVVKTFFDGSAREALAALLDMNHGKMSKAELDQLAQLVEDARKEGR